MTTPEKIMLSTVGVLASPLLMYVVYFGFMK